MKFETLVKTLLENFTEIVYIPATELQGGEYGDSSSWHNFKTTLSKEEKLEWAKKVSLKEPIDVSVYSGGDILFNNGHHRVMAARILNKNVPCIISKNGMQPNIWKEYLNRLHTGFKKWVINPENKSNIKYVPSIEQLKTGKHMLENGKEPYEVSEFYDKHDINGIAK